MSLYYYKDMFTVQNVEQAKDIILTEEKQGGNRQERWDRETGYTMELVAAGLGDLSGKTILDFGCGIGRLSKALLERYDCHVLGVDISASMRRMALEYVDSERFSVLSYKMFCQLAGQGRLQLDCGLAVYVLQHVYDPQHDIQMLRQVLTDKLLVLNTRHRALPVIDSDTGAKSFYLEQQPPETADVAGLLAQHFVPGQQLALDAEKISLAEAHWCRVYKAQAAKG